MLLAGVWARSASFCCGLAGWAIAVTGRRGRPCLPWPVPVPGSFKVASAVPVPCSLSLPEQTTIAMASGSDVTASGCASGSLSVRRVSGLSLAVSGRMAAHYYYRFAVSGHYDVLLLRRLPVGFGNNATLAELFSNSIPVIWGSDDSPSVSKQA